MKVIIILLLASQTLFSQSLENLQGPYLCEEDGFFHLYEFKKKKLEVTLNFKDLFVVKHTFYYGTHKTKNKDSINVYKHKHIMERLVPLNLKDDKSSYDSNTSTNTDPDCCHHWVLEKFEGVKLFIKLIPIQKTTLFGKKSEIDSTLIRHIILTPITD